MEAGLDKTGLSLWDPADSPCRAHLVKQLQELSIVKNEVYFFW